MQIGQNTWEYKKKPYFHARLLTRVYSDLKLKKTTY